MSRQKMGETLALEQKYILHTSVILNLGQNFPAALKFDAVVSTFEQNMITNYN